MFRFNIVLQFIKKIRLNKGVNMDEQDLDEDDIQNDEEQDACGVKVIELEEALKYVSRFFLYHSDQRLKTLRYFLIYLLAISTGFYSVWIEEQYPFLAIGTIVSIIITLVFWLLECRNKQFIDINSKACELIENELVRCL